MADIVSAYQEGKSSTELGKEFGVSPSTISMLLNDQGVSMRQVYHRDESVFDQLTTEGMYWMGFIATDGCVLESESGEPCRTVVTLKHDDIAHLHKMAAYFKTDYPIRIYDGGKSQFARVTTKHCHLAISSKRIAQQLVDRGIVPRKTHLLKVTDELAESPDFWRGAIDGDGWISYRKLTSGNSTPIVGLCSASRAFIEQFRRFVVSLRPGFDSLIRSSRGRGSTEDLHELRVGSASALTLVQTVYGRDCVSLDRKQDLADQIMATYTPSGNCNLSDWTLDKIEVAYLECGSWKALAQKYGLLASSIQSRYSDLLKSSGRKDSIGRRKRESSSSKQLMEQTEAAFPNRE